jgi:hypothetical protein
VWRHTTTHCAVHAPNRSLFTTGWFPRFLSICGEGGLLAFDLALI